MKAGIIRCMQTEDYCPGTTDFKIIRERKGVFAGISEEMEITGFVSCGGCPGKKAVLLKASPTSIILMPLPRSPLIPSWPLPAIEV